MAEKDNGNTAPPVNPATSIKTPSLPTKSTRNDGSKTVRNSPDSLRGGVKR